jgi:hypothetical protein
LALVSIIYLKTEQLAEYFFANKIFLSGSSKTGVLVYYIGELPSRPKDRGGSMVMMTTTTGTNICQKNCETNAVTLRFTLANT